MAKIDSWITTRVKDYPYPQVEQATRALLETIRRLDRFAKPKQFSLHHCQLLKFERVPSDGKMHRIKVEYPPDKMIDEIFVWQIIGAIGDKVVNVVSEWIFHTHENNRSGNTEWHINGKDAYLRKDLGGLSIEDIWQADNPGSGRG